MEENIVSENFTDSQNSQLNGYGDGYGYGDGDGYGYGYGYGSGDGSGDGSGEKPKEFLNLVANKLNAQWVLAEQNAELRRILIECMGADRFFSQLNATQVHSDIDRCGNPRALLRFKLNDAEVGYIQAVRVVCPTTGRVYHLGVPPTVKTCQEAVASTFKMNFKEYAPERES